MNPAISIIVPVYNQEKYLSRCLDSILNQTFEDIEVVCVDDHSSDGSVEILTAYAEKDKRVRIFSNSGKGVADARNFGIDNIRGDYVGFVDSDDYIQPQMYEYMIKAIIENDCDMVACRYEKTSCPEKKTFDYKCRDCDLAEFVDFYNFDFMAKNEMVLSGVWSKLIKADFLKKHSRFEKYKVCEDALFCAVLWANTDKYKLVDLPLYSYFTNSESVVHCCEDWNFVDPVKARYYIYKEYKKVNKNAAAFFLFRGFLLAERCKRDRILKEEKSYKTVNRYFLKMLPYFLTMKEVSLKVRLYHIKKYLIG